MVLWTKNYSIHLFIVLRRWKIYFSTEDYLVFEHGTIVIELVVLRPVDHIILIMVVMEVVQVLIFFRSFTDSLSQWWS